MRPNYAARSKLIELLNRDRPAARMGDNKPPKRGFGFGCRETPDIYDKFLQELGYYRKHTALDTSSLFRVVSEQQHGIQKYHEKVRKDCVMYMHSHKAQFVKDIKWGFEAYMNNMSRMRTHGTLLELKALALLYNANVLLFEPFAEAKWFLHSAANDTVWRVFYGRNNHFDSIYTTEYMINMAECQSIVYDILYTRVLGVPDVQYAVERMLHDPDDTKTTYSEDEEGRQIATTEDGRQLVLSQPHETKCVLIYSHLCHFHNSTSFDAIQRFFAVYGSDEGTGCTLGRTCAAARRSRTRCWRTRSFPASGSCWKCASRRSRTRWPKRSIATSTVTWSSTCGTKYGRRSGVLSFWSRWETKKMALKASKT